MILRFPLLFTPPPILILIISGSSHLIYRTSSFIPSLFTNALASLSIQDSSDHPPLDFLHQEDAVAGVLVSALRIEFVSESRPDASTTVPAVNLVSGER
ncbi:hypothetical protein IAT38_006485 [Cryptococcus sp. DSM 104549]